MSEQARTSAFHLTLLTFSIAAHLLLDAIWKTLLLNAICYLIYDDNDDYAASLGGGVRESFMGGGQILPLTMPLALVLVEL